MIIVCKCGARKTTQPFRSAAVHTVSVCEECRDRNAPRTRDPVPYDIHSKVTVRMRKENNLLLRIRKRMRVA